MTSFHGRTDSIKNCVKTYTCCLLAKTSDYILLMFQELEVKVKSKLIDGFDRESLKKE